MTKVTVHLEDGSTIERKKYVTYSSVYVNYQGSKHNLVRGDSGYRLGTAISERYKCKLGHNGDDCYSYGVWDSEEGRWIGHPDSKSNIELICKRRNK